MKASLRMRCVLSSYLHMEEESQPTKHKELEGGKNSDSSKLVSSTGHWRIQIFQALTSHVFFNNIETSHAAHNMENHLQIIIQVPPLRVLFFKLSAAWINGRVVGWSQLVVLVLVLLLLLLLLLVVVFIIVVVVMVMVMAEQTFFLLNPFDGFSFCLNLGRKLPFDAIRQGITTKLKKRSKKRLFVEFYVTFTIFRIFWRGSATTKVLLPAINASLTWDYKNTNYKIQLCQPFASGW